MSLIGSAVGHIRIVGEIGRGGMGEVYAGVDDRLQRRVALKAIRAEYRLDPGARARFLRRGAHELASQEFRPVELITFCRQRKCEGGDSEN
jgi:serine/threonine-protein kinase